MEWFKYGERYHYKCKIKQFHNHSITQSFFNQNFCNKVKHYNFYTLHNGSCALGCTKTWPFVSSNPSSACGQYDYTGPDSNSCYRCMCPSNATIYNSLNAGSTSSERATCEERGGDWILLKNVDDNGYIDNQYCGRCEGDTDMCTLADGTKIKGDGIPVTAYKAPLPTCPNTCEPVQVTCTNGTLDKGGYAGSVYGGCQTKSQDECFPDLAYNNGPNIVENSLEQSCTFSTSNGSQGCNTPVTRYFVYACMPWHKPEYGSRNEIIGCEIYDSCREAGLCAYEDIPGRIIDDPTTMCTQADYNSQSGKMRVEFVAGNGNHCVAYDCCGGYGNG